jgi:hypothetical protein
MSSQGSDHLVNAANQRTFWASTACGVRPGGDLEGSLSLSVSAEDKRSISDGSYLVDPASSHMLVSKIKPCMS